jgi:hypothetical protein
MPNALHRKPGSHIHKYGRDSPYCYFEPILVGGASDPTSRKG